MRWLRRGSEKVSDEGGLATYEVESAGFSVGVPSDWRALNADEAITEEAVESIREADPELGEIVEAIDAPDSPTELFAVDPEPHNGFATNLNVVVDERSDGITRADYFGSLAPQLDELGITEFTDDRVDLPAGQAQEVTYEHQRGGVDRRVTVLHYVFFQDGVGYTLTYTTPAALFDDRRQEFERSARSFRIL